jgi:hypothetical protein
MAQISSASSESKIARSLVGSRLVLCRRRRASSEICRNEKYLFWQMKVLHSSEDLRCCFVMTEQAVIQQVMESRVVVLRG